MGGGLLAGSLCVSVGPRSWNLGWCVCSGLGAALSRPLCWAQGERDVEEYVEEKIRKMNGSMGSETASAQVKPDSRCIQERGAHCAVRLW